MSNVLDREMHLFCAEKMTQSSSSIFEWMSFIIFCISECIGYVKNCHWNEKLTLSFDNNDESSNEMLTIVVYL